MFYGQDFVFMGFPAPRLSSKCTSIIVKLAKKKKQSVYGVGRMMWNAFSVISNKSIGS